MGKKFFRLTLALVFIVLLVLSGCDPDNTVKPPAAKTTVAATQRGNTGTIDTGKPEIVASASIPSAGGSITVSKPGTPVDGLKLEVPAGAYTGAVDFTVSYAPIEKQSFGELCNPLTPVITVEGADAFSEELMSITVPVAVPEGQFAMGFIYDPVTRQLTGMSTVAQDDKSITIAARHFCAFFISAVDKSLLRKDIETSYRPAIDDWQFHNYGSYIADSGHCAGQSVTSIWYFMTQPDGEGYTLNGRYDNNAQDPATPKLDYDDSLGYRFASVIQRDMDWDNWQFKFWKRLAGVDDSSVFNLTAYSMRLTGVPQEVIIWSKDGTGHEMVCYRVFGGELYIADPNYPGNLNRRITFNSGNMTFTPYNSGANAEEIAQGKGKAYEKIQFMPQKTTIDWRKISARWKEMKVATIGKGIFPDYELVYQDEKGQIQLLNDGFVSSRQKILIGARSTDGKADIHFNIYRDGEKLAFGQGFETELLPGNNNLGVHVFAEVKKYDADGKYLYTIYPYIDFVDVNVVYGSLFIDPDEVVGETGSPVTFTARSANPAGARFKWMVDDKVVQEGASGVLTTSFDDEGFYIVSVVMMDKSGKEIAGAMATAAILPGGSSPEIQNGFSYLNIEGQLWGLYHYEYSDGSSEDVEEDPSYYVTFHQLTWSGGSFKGASGRWTIDGKVNNDNSLTFALTYDNTQADIGGEGKVVLTVNGLPYDIKAGKWYLEGPGLQKYVSLTDTYKDRIPKSHKLLHLNWNFKAGDTDHWAYLDIDTD